MDFSARVTNAALASCSRVAMSGTIAAAFSQITISLLFAR